jgi:hypothetical protein
VNTSPVGLLLKHPCFKRFEQESQRIQATQPRSFRSFSLSFLFSFTPEFEEDTESL